MDEQEYRSTYHSINGLRCVFEKAILSRRSNCSRCTRFHLADREGAACDAASAQGRCQSLLERLRRSAIFALKITAAEGPLPHAKEIKVQNGGLLGLQGLLAPDADLDPHPEKIEDVAGLINDALLRYGDLDALPYNEIVQAVVKFEGRKRRPKRK